MNRPCFPAAFFLVKGFGYAQECCPSRYLTMAASSSVTMPGYQKSPAVDSGGAFVVRMTWSSSLVTWVYSLFSDRGLCCGQVDDCLVGGVGRDQRGDGEVVHRPRITARGEVNGMDRVVGEEWI